MRRWRVADETPALVKARESYWAGEVLVPADTVMAASDPRVRAAHVVPFEFPVPSVEPPAPDPPAKPARTSKSS